MFKEWLREFLGVDSEVRAIGPGLLAAMTNGSTGTPRPGRGNAREFLGRYADQAWVYICVAILQTKLAGVPIKIYKKADDEEVPTHPLKALLDKPNPFMNGKALLNGTTGFVALVGDGYWALDEFVGGKPTSMYPVDPSKMKITASKDKFITGYVYEPMPGVEPVTFQPHEILHFKTWNPLDPFYGMPPLAAARDQSDLIMNADRYNRAFFENNAEPGGILTSDGAIDETSFKRIATSWKKMHQGVRKAYKTAILDGGLKWQDVTKSHRDMQFVDLKKMSREDVLGVYRIPAAMAGIYTDAKYDNADMQRRTFWQDTMQAWMDLVIGEINAGLVQPYDDTVYAMFDLSSVPELQEDKKQKAEEDEILTRAGIKKINEVRAERKLPPVPWGEEPLQVQSARQAAEAIAGSEEEEEDEDEDKGKKKPKKEEETDEEKAVKKSALRRGALWLEFKDSTERGERKWRAEVAGLFNQQEREVKANLRNQWEKKAVQARLDGTGGKVKQVLDAILFDGSEARKLWRREGRRLMMFTLQQSASEQAQRHDMVRFDMTNPRVVRWLDDKAFKFSDEVNKTTEEALREALEAGVKEGDTILQVAKRIEDVFDAARGWRAERIARTEVVAASNKGAIELYVQNGVQRVEWLSARDGNVRESHQIDGQVRGVGAKFSNGLEFPGDPSAPPDETINCRCAIAPAPKEA